MRRNVWDEKGVYRAEMGEIMRGMTYTCPSCKGYSIYLPYGELGHIKLYLKDVCPHCGIKLVDYEPKFDGLELLCTI